MKQFCASRELIMKDPEFQRILKLFPNINPNMLIDYLAIYREHQGYNEDWYPSGIIQERKFKYWVNNFKKSGVITSESMTTKSMIRDVYNELASVYTPKVLSSRVNMLADMFSKEIDSFLSKTSKLSRREAIKEMGGIRSIMNDIFENYFKDVSSEDAMKRVLEGFGVDWNSLSERGKRTVDKRVVDYLRAARTLYEHRDAIASLVYKEIGEREGLVVRYRNYEPTFEEINEQKLEEKDGQRADGTSVENTPGDRYVDFRTLSFHSTLSKRARALINSVRKTDFWGRPVCDDMSYPQYLNGRQVSYALLEIFRGGSDKNMMETFEKGLSRFPWLKGLYNELKKNPDLRTVIWENFHTTQVKYGYLGLNKGYYSSEIANRKSQNNSLYQEAKNNAYGGYVVNPESSIYGHDGRVIEGSLVSHLREIITPEITKSIESIKFISYLEGKKTSKSRDRTEYLDIANNEGNDKAMQKFLNDHPEVISAMVKALQGLGFRCTVQNILDIAFTPVNSTTEKLLNSYRSTTNYNYNRIAMLAAAIRSAYSNIDGTVQRKIKHGETEIYAAELYDIHDKVFNTINYILAPAVDDQVDDSVLQDGSRYTTHAKYNLLSEMVERLSNQNGLSEEEYLKMLHDVYLQYEGYTLDGKPVGLIRKLLDLDERGRYSPKDLGRVNYLAANHVSYGELTPAQKVTAQLIMFVKGIRGGHDGVSPTTGKVCYIESPIQGDYKTAWDFIAMPFYETGRELGFDENWNNIADEVGMDVEPWYYNGRYNLSYTNEALNYLTDEVMVEVERMIAITERQKSDPDGTGRSKLSVYEEQGMRFLLFPKMNNDPELAMIFESDSNPMEFRDFIRRKTAEYMWQEIQAAYAKIEEIGVLSNRLLSNVIEPLYSKTGKISGLLSDGAALLQNFIVNDFINKHDITKYTVGDFVQFTGIADFEKRNMMSHATRGNMYTEATWKGQRVGKNSQNVMYISDDKAPSKFRDEEVGMLKRLLKDGRITEEQFKYMASVYDSINSTDGQGYRTFESYRETMVSQDKWTDRLEEAYKKILSGDYTHSDVDTIIRNAQFIGQKPIYTGFEHIPAAQGEHQKPIKLAVLHKYSEAVLLPELLFRGAYHQDNRVLGGFSKANEILRERQKKGERVPQVDLFIFHSGVKVGAHDIVTDIFDRNEDGSYVLKTADDVASAIVEHAVSHPNTVHTLDYSGYGESASVTEHGADESIAWSSQIEKVAWSNLEANDTVDGIVGKDGKPMKSTEARDTFNEINAATYIQAYADLAEFFTDGAKLEQFLNEELASKSYNSPELRYALRALRDGNFALPLYSPSTARAVEQLLMSVIKKRTSRPYSRGMNILQVSSVGNDVNPFMDDDKFADTLGIVFEGEGQNRRVKYIECYVPVFDSRLEKFVDENGAITPKALERLVAQGKIPEDLLTFIAYRTPSDDLHSAVPLRIKGFMSKNSGASIIMPKDVMKLTGHDYDGDKMRAHFKSFTVTEEVIDEDAIDAAFDRYQKNNNPDIVRYILGQTNGYGTMDRDQFRRLVLKKDYIDRDKYVKSGEKISVHKYDYSKSAIENSQEARNNAKVELLFAHMTSPSGSRRLFIPGGSEETTRLANVLDVTKRLVREYGDGNSEVDAYVLRELGISNFSTRSVNYIYDTLMKNAGVAEQVRKILNAGTSPFGFAHSVDAFEQIIGGANMIDVFALYSSALQMFQQLDLKYIPRVTKAGQTQTVTIMGHTIDKICGSRSADGSMSSLILARWVNAAVDNGKNPVLGVLGFNPNVSKLIVFLAAAGYTEEQIVLILNQPALVEVVKRMETGSNLGRVANELAMELAGSSEDMNRYLGWIYGADHLASLDKSDFVYGVTLSLDDIKEDLDKIANQIALLTVISSIYPAAETLDSAVRTTRPEATSGGVQSTISKTVEARFNFTNNIDDITFDPRISGFDFLNTPIDADPSVSAEHFMEQIGETLPQVVALNEISYRQSLALMEKWFPYAKESWYDAVKKISRLYRHGRIYDGLAQSIFEELMEWEMLKNKNFAPDVEAMRRDKVIEVPFRLKTLKERINRAVMEVDKNGTTRDWAAYNLKDNVFLSKLTTDVKLKSERQVPRIRFNLGGVTSEGISDRIRYSWAQLAVSEDPEVRKLATDLYLYNFFTSGFGFGMYEFIHFAPANVIMSIPGYIGKPCALTGLRKKQIDTDSADFSNFIEQYYLNHWGDTRLVPKINANYLTDEALSALGYPSSVGSKTRKTIGIEDLKTLRYFVVQSGSGKKNAKLALFKVSRGSNGQYSFDIAPKIGIRTEHGQRYLQYNPDILAEDMKPLITGDDSSWGLLSRDKEYEGPVKKISSGQMSDEEASAYTDSLTQKNQSRSFEDKLRMSFGISHNKDKKAIIEKQQAIKGTASNGIILEETEASGKRISISSGYRKNDPSQNPDTDYVFTDNLEAYSVTHNVSEDELGFEFPFRDRKNVRINVSTSGMNQAGIRTDKYGRINKNAYGVITKKYQHNERGNFVVEEALFNDTEEDFALFTKYNSQVFDAIENSSNSKLVFPGSMATSKASLPLRFAEWLQSQMFERFGVQSDIVQHNSGYSINIVGVDNAQPEVFEQITEEAVVESHVVSESTEQQVETTTPNLIRNPFNSSQMIDMNKILEASAKRQAQVEQRNNASGTKTSSKGKMLKLARTKYDENGNASVSVEEVPVTPGNLAEARKQEAYRILRERLTEMLRQAGISVGVLDEAEIKMGLAGITDFEALKVISEGLSEAVRIAKGQEGAEALPEEFAHITMAMLGENHPLVKRLVDAVRNNAEALHSAFEEGEYQEYLEYYEGDMDKMAFEAAGKLVAKHLYRHQRESMDKPWMRLVHRVANALREFLAKTFNFLRLKNTVVEVEAAASNLGRSLLEGRLLDALNATNVSRSGQYYKVEKVQKDISKRRNVLDTIMQNLVKQHKIYTARSKKYGEPKSKMAVRIENQIKTVEGLLKSYRTEDALLEYSKSVLEILSAASESMYKAVNSGKPINDICKLLNVTHDTIYGYRNIVHDIREAMHNGEIKNTQELNDRIVEIENVLSMFNTEYERLSTELFEDTLRELYPNGVKVTTGRYKGQTRTAHDIATTALHDVGFMSRWVDCLAHCGDEGLAAVDSMTRHAKFMGRKRAQEFKKTLDVAFAKMVRETGSRDQSWIFEYDKDGHKTGRYISYSKAKKLSAPKFAYWKTVMDLKKQCDNCLPSPLVKPLKIVMLRKTMVDRVLSSSGVKDASLDVAEGIKMAFCDMDKDMSTDYQLVNVGFGGSKIDLLPIRYLNKAESESYDDMSDDVATAMLTYASMAFEYNEMNNIIGILENAKQALGRREVIQETGSKRQEEHISTEVGNTEYYYEKPYSKKQVETQMQQVLEDFYQMHVYGHVQKAEGNFGRTKVSKRKVVNFINSMTSFLQIAGNLNAQIANMVTGFANIILESATGGEVSMKTMMKAIGTYIRHTADRLAETGSTDTDNKLSLFMEMFDVDQNNGRQIPKYQRTRMRRVLSTNLLYSGLQIGEDAMTATTALSLAYSTKLKDSNGKSITLWDAYEVKYSDPANKTGAYLSLKKGVTKQDGTAFSEEDIYKFSKKVAGVNFQLQGIYNLDDRSAIEQYAFGALVIMYRKWIAPNIKRRYGASKYNNLLDRYEEGYYRTTGKFLYDSIFARGGMAIIDSFKMNYEKMTDYERSNFKKAFLELGIWLGCIAAMSILSATGGDDDDDNFVSDTWLGKRLYYTVLRLKVEIGSLTPWGMPRELMNMLRNPIPATGAIDSIYATLQTLLPWNWFDEIENGRYAGHSTAYKYLWRTPVFALYRRMENFIDPEPLIRYYQNQQ